LKLAVVGSMNLDISLVVGRMPVLGECLRSGQVVQVPGGKGANQAVAAARNGAEVYMFGQVGSDSFAEIVKNNLLANGVNVDGVLTDPQTTTGLAFIFVEGGDNRIVLAGGANDSFSPGQVQALGAQLLACDAVLLQNENRVETLASTIELCKGKLPIFLNPAPAMAYPEGLLDGVDYLTPNQTELAFYTGRPLEGDDSLKVGLQLLRGMGVHEPLITLGAGGVAWLKGNETRIMPGFKVETVDSTGAGDTFAACFAVRRMLGDALEDAIRYAQAAAALACTRLGAQAAIPQADEVWHFLREND
jgi:ribokinase